MADKVLISPRLLNLPQGVIQSVTDAFTLTASASETTSGLAGKTAGADDAGTLGVFTTAPNNKVRLFVKDTGDILSDDTGNQVYGRLTESGGTFTITFYTLVGGTETAFTFSSESAVGKMISMKYVEVKQIKDIKPSDAVAGLDFVDESDYDTRTHQAYKQNFTATAGQTSFTLDHLPNNASSVRMELLGHNLAADTSIVGKVVTYGGEVPLENGDIIIFQYDY